jgi:hypothetical protein
MFVGDLKDDEILFYVREKIQLNLKRNDMFTFVS